MSDYQHIHRGEDMDAAISSVRSIKSGTPPIGSVAWRHALDVPSAEQAQATALSLAQMRQPVDRLVSDGTTANRRIEYQMGAHGNVAGSSLTLLADMRVRVPSSGGAGIVHFVGSTTENTFEFRVLANGTLNVIQIGTTLGNSRSFNYAGFGAAYNLKQIKLAMVFPSGNSTTNPTVLLWSEDTGVLDITSEFVLSTEGTPPNWMPLTMDTTNYLNGLNYPAGDGVPVVVPVNRAWSEAEFTAWATTGQLPVADALGGSMVNRISNGDFSSFTGTVDDGTPDAFTDWTTGSNLISEATSNGLKLLVGPGWASNVSGANLFRQNYPVQIGRRYGYRIRARALGATTEIGVFTGTTSSAPDRVFANLTPEFTTIWVEHVAVNTPNIAIQPRDGSAVGVDGVEVSSIKMFELGALTIPTIQPGAVLDDASGNGQAGKLVGIRAVTPKKTSRAPINATNSVAFPSNLNLFLGDLQPARSVLVGVAWERVSGSGGFRLGTTSGGTDISAAITDASGYIDGAALSNRVNLSNAPRAIYSIHGASTTHRFTFFFAQLNQG